MFDYLRSLFDTSGFPPRWYCGNWTAAQGWLNILSDLGVWSAYIAIPCVLGFFVLRRRDIPFRSIFLLFGAFILACGTTHLMEALIFWWPAYRLAGAIKLFTAVVSWCTVVALVPAVPRVLAMRSPEELEREIAARKLAEAGLSQANAALEQHVEQRTTELTQAVRALQAEREFLRTTLGSIGDGVIATDIQGRVTYLNPVAEALTGWATADANLVPLPEVFQIVHEHSRQRIENPAAKTLREGVMVGLGNHAILLGKDGIERPIDDSAAPIRDSGGAITGAVLVFRDITKRKAEEIALAERGRLTALRADVTMALASDHATPAALQLCCEALVQHVDVAFARIWTLDDANQMLVLQASAGLYTHLDGPHSRVPVGQFKIGRIASSGQAHLTNAVPDDPNVSDREWARREGMVSFAGYPLVVENRVIGVAAMFARRPLTAAVLTDLAPLVEGIAQFIDRRHGEERFRQQAELHKTTLASIGDAVLTTDTAGHITNLNAVAEALTGWKNAEALGQPLDTVFRIVNEQTRQPVENPAKRSLQEGVIVGLANHTLLLAKDGTERPIDDSAAPIRRPDGEIVGCVLVFRDVSERRRHEERERRLHAEAAATNAKLRAFFEQGALFAAIMDLDGTILEPNRLSYEGCGYTREQVIGKLFWECPWWAPSPLLVERIKAASARAAAGETMRAETPYFVADGSQRIADVIILPIKDDAGRVLFLGPTGMDITDRKRAEAERQKFVTLAENSTDFIGICSFEGMPLYLNRAGIAMVGLESMRQALGTHLKDFFFPEDQERMLEEFLPAVLEKGHCEIEIRFRHFKTGTALWMLYNLFVLTDPGGERIGLATVSRDITQRRQLEDHLRRLAADLSEADHRKDEFLATLAHELRNPLAPIRNGLQVLRLEANDARAVEQVRSMMERQLGQMVRLVDDLLDVSRITRNKLELRKERVDLAEVLASAVETSRPLIQANGHAFTMALPTEPIILHADLTRLAQVFSNLLNNAAKYTEHGGHISLTAQCARQEVAVAVKDDGVGIRGDMLPKVFEMFTQADRVLERSQGGLGIGLTLVRKLVEMHDGTVEAFSEGVNKGSEFVVRLPIATGPRQPPPGAMAAEPRAPRSSHRILVVDDNRDSADSLAMMLTLMGNQTKTAHDGLEALALSDAFQPDVVLLDIGLPKLNGYETARRLRQRPWAVKVILVAVTGWGQDEDRRRSREAGFDHHLVKPIDPDALIKLLASVDLAAK